MKKIKLSSASNIGKPGIEPEFFDPESNVLPLNHFPLINFNKINKNES
jgi:hypothetical protein